MSVLALLLSTYAYAEQDKESVEVCAEAAKIEDISSEEMKAYIAKCVQDIEDAKKEQADLPQDSK